MQYVSVAVKQRCTCKHRLNVVVFFSFYLFFRVVVNSLVPYGLMLVGWVAQCGRTSVSDRRTFTGLHRTCTDG